MDLDGVEAQPVQAEAAALESAQNLSRANQEVVPVQPSTSTSSNFGELGFPSITLFDRQAGVASDGTNVLGPNLGGHVVELAPPGSPFSFQMFVPDNVGPHTLPNAQGDGTQPNMVPNSDRTLPNAKPDITSDDIEDARGDDPDGIRARMTPGNGELPNMKPRKGKDSILDGAAKELGELLNDRNGERIREFLRNHLRRHGRHKL